MFGLVLASFLIIGLFLLYGPITYFRETLITSAMTTMHHQYLARWFYREETILKVLEKHQVLENMEQTDPSFIDETSTFAPSKYEKQLLNRKPHDLYQVIPVSGKGYRGYLVAIYDPSKIRLATTSKLGVEGEWITTIAKETNAKVVINAGGFFDPNWNGMGGLPHGTVIQNGQIVSDYQDASVGGGFIGFTFDHKLLLGKMTKEEALTIGFRDAIEFGPFLIVNGKPSFIKGNGGWGIAPRTAIGQRRDGIVLFLVINGRIPTSIGADMLDLTKVMQQYGAYNAANLDGGSSTELLVEGKIVNKPVGNGKQGLRKMPTFWIVTKS